MLWVVDGAEEEPVYRVVGALLESHRRGRWQIGYNQALAIKRATVYNNVSREKRC